MDHHDPHHQHNTLWWITSLAISVTCCAVLFVVFAGYVVNIKEDLAMAKLHADMVDQRLNMMALQMDNLYRRGSAVPMPNAVSAPAPASIALPTVPSNVPANPPSAPVPEAVNPSAAAAPGVTPGSVIGTTAPTAVSPPAASPTAVPEVPARQ